MGDRTIATVFVTFLVGVIKILRQKKLEGEKVYFGS